MLAAILSADDRFRYDIMSDGEMIGFVRFTTSLRRYLLHHAWVAMTCPYRWRHRPCNAPSEDEALRLFKNLQQREKEKQHDND